MENKDTAPWGILTSLDLYGCNPEIIRDPEKIRQYVIQLCDLIGMKRFGDCQVADLSKEFFQAESIEIHVIKRR